MKKRSQTREELIHELDGLRRRVAELEATAPSHESIAGALMQSEAKFRKLAQKSVVGVCIIQDGVLKYVNPKFAEIFGYKVKEIANKIATRAVVVPKDWSRAEYFINQRMSGEYDAVSIRFRGMKKDGEVIEVEAYGTHATYAGHPAMMGTIVEITDRMRAKGELEKQLKKFRALYTLVVAMTAERGLSDNLRLFVETSKELLGTDTASFAMRDEEAGELYWQATSGIVTQAFKDLRIPLGAGLAGLVAETGESIVVEDYFRQKGPRFHEVVRNEGLISGIGIPVVMGGINLGVLLAFNRTKTVFHESDLNTQSLLANIAAVEISRKRYQEGLRKSQESYRDLYEKTKRGEDLYISFLNSSADAVAIVDRQFKTRFVSPSFTRIFGWTLDELRGKRLPIVPDSEQESAQALMDRVVRDGMPVIGLETRRTRRDGSLLDVSISAAPYHYRGSTAGMSIVYRDITPFKSIERARRRAVNHLSHELMTPLAVIEASVHRLRRKLQPEQGMERTLQRILRNLKRLKDVQEIVQEIAVPRPHRPRTFDIEATIRSIIEEMRENAPHRSIKVVTRLERVQTDGIDPEAFRIILSTLMKNAIENTPDEGEITLSLKAPDSDVLLTVEDTGVGIPAGDREFILEGFHHTQPTDSYATKKPFDFNAGGKGLELMRLKILSEEGWFDIVFDSHRCRYLPTNAVQCPGRISLCTQVENSEDCRRAGGTTFTVRFHPREDLTEGKASTMQETTTIPDNQRTMSGTEFSSQ